MLNDLRRGASYLVRGFSLIRRPGLRRYAIAPVLLNVLLFGGLLYLGFSQFAPLVHWVMAQLPSWLGFLEWLLWIIFTSLTAIVVFFAFTPVANIVAAPFNAILSEKLEAMLTGRAIESDVGLLTIVTNSIRSQLGKLVYIGLWSLGLVSIGFIPVINFLVPLLWIAFGSWLLALEYMDYPMGNHDMTFREQQAALNEQRGLALGFGGAVMALTGIPIVNFIVLPVATAGATAMWVERLSGNEGSG